MINFAKIVLNHDEPNLNATSDELSKVIISRLGLIPRKKGSTERMHHLLVEFYERSKTASREKNPKEAVITVEEMGSIAGITRQTMYDYLKRWLVLDLITKTSFVGNNNEVIIGYKLNGPTLEAAFDKARMRINNHMESTSTYIKELQKTIKNDKIKQSQSIKHDVSSSDITESANLRNIDE